MIESRQKPANAGLLGIVNESDLIISRQKSGTYMHRVLAIKFAAW
nr:MAG TPA: N KilA-N domain [Caudoviricetes sp.]